MEIVSPRGTVSLLNSKMASRNVFLWPDTIEQAGAAAILQTLNGRSKWELPTMGCHWKRLL